MRNIFNPIKNLSTFTCDAINDVFVFLKGVTWIEYIPHTFQWLQLLFGWS